MASLTENCGGTMADSELQSWRRRCVGEVDRLIDEVRRLTAVNENLMRQLQSRNQVVRVEAAVQQLRVTEREAAKILGICPRTLFRRRPEGKLAYIKDGCKVFYDMNELQRYSRDAMTRATPAK